MANNFNASEFFKGAYFAPIELGKHSVVVDKASVVFDADEDGNDKSYLALDLKFENNRVVSTRFYGIGAKIATDQLRTQLQDKNDYRTAREFIKTIKGQTVDCFVSKRSYEKDGKVNTTLQYDFVEREEAVEGNPFA